MARASVSASLLLTPFHRGRWLIWMFAALLISLAWLTWRVFNFSVHAGSPFFPPEMNGAAHAAGDAIGDLGGMPVSIPKGYSRYLEYEGDPGFGEQRNGQRPRRTFKSRIISFGFDVRFPNMELKPLASTAEGTKIRGRGDWLTVSVISGSIFPKNGTSNLYNYYTASGNITNGYYRRAPKALYGLDAYILESSVDDRGEPYRFKHGAKDLFAAYDNTGAARTFITCSIADGDDAMSECTHSFSLEPNSKSSISIYYARPLLVKWQLIEESVRATLLQFHSITR